MVISDTGSHSNRCHGDEVFVVEDLLHLQRLGLFCRVYVLNQQYLTQDAIQYFHWYATYLSIYIVDSSLTFPKSLKEILVGMFASFL